MPDMNICRKHRCIKLLHAEIDVPTDIVIFLILCSFKFYTKELFMNYTKKIIYDRLFSLSVLQLWKLVTEQCLVFHSNKTEKCICQELFLIFSIEKILS